MVDLPRGHSRYVEYSYIVPLVVPFRNTWWYEEVSGGPVWAQVLYSHGQPDSKEHVTHVFMNGFWSGYNTCELYLNDEMLHRSVEANTGMMYVPPKRSELVLLEDDVLDVRIWLSGAGTFTVFGCINVYEELL